MALLSRIDLAASESNFQTSLKIVHRGTRAGLLWVALTGQAICMYRMRKTGATEEDESEIASLLLNGLRGL